MKRLIVYIFSLVSISVILSMFITLIVGYCNYSLLENISSRVVYQYEAIENIKYCIIAAVFAAVTLVYNAFQFNAWTSVKKEPLVITCLVLNLLLMVLGILMCHLIIDDLMYIVFVIMIILLGLSVALSMYDYVLLRMKRKKEKVK